MKVALVALLVLFASPPPPAPDRVYVGVACRVAGTDCGRVGVAVWLPRPAIHVRATLLAKRVVLTTGHGGSGMYGFRRYWTGFARFSPGRVHAGTTIRIRVVVGETGGTRTDTEWVRLSAGWG